MANGAIKKRNAVTEEASDGPTFAPFLRLPAEIQLKIWTLHGTKPRVIVQAEKYESIRYPNQTIMKPCPTPVQLHVHHQSRQEFLYREEDEANEQKDHPMYQFAFRSTKGKLIFLSYESDTILLRADGLSKLVCRSLESQINQVCRVP